MANSNETIFDDAAQSVLICRATAPPVIFAPGNIRNDYSVDIYFLFAEQIISFKRTDMRMSIINAAAQAENTSLKRHRSRSRGVQVSRCDAGWARLRNPEAENAALLWFKALLHCVASNQRKAQNHPKGCRGCACGPSAPLDGPSGSRPLKEGISIVCCRDACVLYVHAASVIASDICLRKPRLHVVTETNLMHALWTHVGRLDSRC